MSVKSAACSGFNPPAKKALAFDPERGKLYRFSPEQIEVIRLGDPYPAAYLKTAQTGIWQNRPPKSAFPWLFAPPLPLLPEYQSEALQKFIAFSRILYENVVAWMGEEHARLLDRYASRSWWLHCLLIHGGDRALELTRSNPALAWLISAHAVYHPLAGKRYWRSARSLLDKRRRDILGYFGFPDSEAAVKLFSRIRPQSCSTDLLFILRKQLRESPDLLRQLSFFPCHNAISLRIICSRLRPQFSYHALAAVAALDPFAGEREFNHKLRDVLGMRKALAANGDPPPGFLLRSLADLDTLHDDLVHELNQAELQEDLEFGPAPLPDIMHGGIWIESVRRSSELLREGRELRHCIFSYHDLIAGGEWHVARMLVPERLTLLYRESRDSLSGAACLELEEARGLRNALPDPASLRLIKLWLQRQDLQLWDPDQLTIFDGWEPGELPAESGAGEL